MNKKIKTEAVDYLFDAILSLQNREECYIFFEDICTVNELLSLSQRFEVASMLKDRKTYLEIAEKTGASTATISRVNRSHNTGKSNTVPPPLTKSACHNPHTHNIRKFLFHRVQNTWGVLLIPYVYYILSHS